MHLRLAAQPLHVVDEVPVVGADGAAQSVVVFKVGAEAEWEHGGVFEALRDHARMVTLRLLVHAGVIFRGML